MESDHRDLPQGPEDSFADHIHEGKRSVSSSIDTTEKAQELSPLRTDFHPIESVHHVRTDSAARPHSRSYDEFHR